MAPLSHVRAQMELTRKINTSGRPRRRPLAWLVAGVIGAIVVVAALLALGGRGTTRASGGHGGPRPSASMPIANPPPGTCASGSSETRTRREHARQSALDRVLSATLRRERRRLHLPAATAAVVVCGRVVWADATGVVDLRSRRPATNGSLFILNSAAKTFVATMVMREIQAGHLSLQTRLSRFYPWLPNARQITIRNLLNMTSGLRDYLYNPRIESVMDHHPRHHWTVDQLLTGLGSGLGPPRFAPGHGFRYSDTNYILLGAILERVTHRPIEQLFQRLIARPLGITSATFVPTPAAKALIAHPYLRWPDRTLTSPWIPGFGVSTAVWGPVFTDGGLAASSLQVARFANALLAGKLVDTAAVKEMTDISRRGDYGFGMRGRSFGGHYWVGHRGYFGGFEAEDWSDPSRQVTIAVSDNLQLVGGGPVSTPIWRAIARVYDRHTGVTGRARAGAAGGGGTTP